MSSTNKTTHYNLSQYVASDKPTYLVDYNADMSAIDSGIYEAKSEADTNTVAIGTLSSLTTTEKTNLVSAINEIDGDLGNLSGTVGQHTTDIATNTSAIGNLTSLNTTAKSNLVAAVNEVNTTASEINKLNLTTFTEYTSFTAIAGTVSGGKITVAKNSDGSIAKIYGYVNGTSTSNRFSCKITDTGLAPLSDITINPAGVTTLTQAYGAGVAYITIKTNGDIEFYGTLNASPQQLWFMPCLYFIENFGDTPE